MAIRIAIADDHPTLLVGMEYLLSDVDDLELVGMAADSTALVDLLCKHSCDVVVTDYAMPGGRYGDGVSLLGFLRRRFPSMRLVVLTGLDSAAIFKVIVAAEIDALVSKRDEPTHLFEAIRATSWSGTYLSPSIRQVLGVQSSFAALSARETEVVRLFAEGLSVAGIGERVDRSRKTISVQKMSAMRKLGLESDAELVRYALASGLIQGAYDAKWGAI